MGTPDIDTLESRKGNLPLILLLVIVFLLLVAYTFAANIHGDGKTHTLYAREIAETGYLLKYEPYSLCPGAEETTYLPIYYPQTSHVLMSLFYIVGQENALKLFSPILGVLSAFFAYALLRHVSKYGALAAAFLTVLLNIQRFIMVPLIEQLLLFGMLATLYFYYLFLKKRERKYVFLTGLFLGLVLATKQQGLVFCFVILIHAGLTVIAEKARSGDFALLRQIVPIFAIAAIVSSGPLLDQLDRNGTIIEIGNFNIPPFCQPKLPMDAESYAKIQDIIGYDVIYSSPWETLGAYSLHIFFYQGSVGFLREHAIAGSLLSLFICLVGLMGALYIFKKDRLVASLVCSVFLAEFVVTYTQNSRPFQYNNVGLAMVGIMVVFGLLNLREHTRWGGVLGFTANLAIPVVFVLGALLCCISTVLVPSWGDSDRLGSDHIQAYQEMGEFVSDTIPGNAVFLTGGGTGTAFQYYARRRTVWISEWGGANVPLIFSQSEEVALHWLKFYGVDYIFIDMRQTGYHGLSDYVPAEGLMEYIDSSPHFKRSYGLDPASAQLRIYEVIY